MDMFLLLEAIFLSFGNEMEIEIPAISEMTQLMNRGSRYTTLPTALFKGLISEGKCVWGGDTHTPLACI